MSFIIVAFYTENTPYEKEIEKLRHSILMLGLKYHFKSYHSRGKWVWNAGIKPGFLLHMLIEHDENIVYVDADAIIRKYPKLFDTISGDLGVRYRNGSVLSGTLFLRNCFKIKEFVREWIIRQIKHSHKWDQITLQETIKDHAERLGVQIEQLPDGYTKIFDFDANITDETVIEHFQASRRFKGEIDRG
jgi:hypothetical protein